MANRLARESSPYLRQHRDNPVDWFPWGEEAFALAKAADKPVFLSIGYSSCHWCHVMAHESFEDEAVAAVLNESFVSVKVDREERPDVDEAYMTAVQLATGRGGWPMTVFLTPDKKPFFAGTYFPRDDRPHQPGFLTICRQIALLWPTKRGEIEENAAQFALGLTEAMDRRAPATSASFDEAFVANAVRALAADFDDRHGGFGSAPKFPPHTSIDFLLQYAIRPETSEELRRTALGMAISTLEKMALGGIHDHVGGGFHRYSTDEEWRLPHFEKMLYDNALMLSNYGLAATILREVDSHLPTFFAETANRIERWLTSEMKSPEGCFYSALDADSEGVEGKFYTWTTDQAREALGGHAEDFIAAYGMRDEGNFRDEATGRLTGENVLILQSRTNPLWTSLDHLGKWRQTRVRPGLDDKIIVAWNGLTIRNLADEEAARHAADAILAAEEAQGGLPHQIVDGIPSGRGYLDDYAAYADALFSLGEDYRDDAERLTRRMIELFWDDEAGGFFGTSEGHEELFGRSKPVFDSPTPSANALAMRCLVAIGDLERAERLIQTFLGWMERAPQATEALYAAALPLIRPAGEMDLLVRLDPAEIVVDESGAGSGEVVISIPDGQHINSSDPPDRWLIPTTVTILPLAARIDYPSAATGVYTGEVRVRFGIELPLESSVADFEVHVRYQACTATECLAPVDRILAGRAIRASVL
ncbi:MAG TPA: DUF255 domain-containing protein [Fimbriimonadaceae bacterium]|nr:DUF255 domain-containing protein [Fimbriimonadaceae bacterium]